MKIVTINLNEAILKALQALQDFGLYPSRSEAIRVALRDFLLNHFQIEKITTNFDEINRKISEIKKNFGNKEKSVEDFKIHISKLLRKIEKDPKNEESIINY